MDSDSDQVLWAAGLVAIALLGLALYAPALGAPFYYDDYQNIVDNPNLRWTEVRADAIWPTAFDAPTRRPVANLSFAASYYFSGLDSTSFRLANVAIHLVSSLVVAWLALALLRQLPDPPAPRTARWMALFAGLVFVAHPLQTQTVTYIVQRMNGLAACLCLVSIAAWLQGRLTAGVTRVGWWCAALAAWLLAMGSKEVAIALPAGVWLCEWIFVQRGNARFLRRSAWLGIPLLLVLGIALYGFALPAIGLGYEGRPFSAGERLLTEMRVVVFYLGLALLPLPGRLNLLHDFALSRSLFDPISTLLSGLVLVALAGLALGLARRTPPLAFGIAWFIAFLSVESFGLPLALVYEHRTYLPMAGLAIAAGWAIFVFDDERSRAALVLGAVIVSLLGVGTLVRNQTWSGELGFWSTTAARSPGLAGAQNNLGMALMRAGHSEDALARFEAALAIDPGEVDAHNNLGTLLRGLGREKEALAHFESAVRISPHHLGARHNLAMSLAGSGRLDEGVAHLEAILDESPRFAHVWNSYGALLVKSDRLGDAKAAFENAVALDPGYAQAAANLAEVKRRLVPAAP